MSITLGAYLSVLLLVSSISLATWKKFRLPDRYIALQMILTFVSEAIALFSAIQYKNSYIVYHFFSPIQFILTSLYFNGSIKTFRAKNIGLKMGLLGIVLSIANSIFLQRLSDINSFFLLFEATVTVLYCLFSFHELLLDELELPFRYGVVAKMALSREVLF